MIKRFRVFLLYFYDNKFAIDFREKAKLFNTFFAEQCSLPKNNSELPKNLLFLTEKRPNVKQEHKKENKQS